MKFADGEGLSQLYLELVGKRFIPENGQVAALKCSSIWKKMRKGFKALSQLKFKFIPRAWKREAMAHKTLLKGSSVKIETLAWLLWFFVKLDHLF